MCRGSAYVLLRLFAERGVLDRPLLVHQPACRLVFEASAGGANAGAHGEGFRSFQLSVLVGGAFQEHLGREISICGHPVPEAWRSGAVSSATNAPVIHDGNWFP